MIERCIFEKLFLQNAPYIDCWSQWHMSKQKSFFKGLNMKDKFVSNYLATLLTMSHWLIRWQWIILHNINQPHLKYWGNNLDTNIERILLSSSCFQVQGTFMLCLFLLFYRFSKNKRIQFVWISRTSARLCICSYSRW